MATMQERQEAAERFVAENIQECCAELIEMQDTAVLRRGKIREVTEMVGYAGYHAHSLALRLVEREALRVVVGDFKLK